MKEIEPGIRKSEVFLTDDNRKFNELWQAKLHKKEIDLNTTRAEVVELIKDLFRAEYPYLVPDPNEDNDVKIQSCNEQADEEFVGVFHSVVFHNQEFRNRSAVQRKPFVDIFSAMFAKVLLDIDPSVREKMIEIMKDNGV